MLNKGRIMKKMEQPKSVAASTRAENSLQNMHKLILVCDIFLRRWRLFKHDAMSSFALSHNYKQSS